MKSDSNLDASELLELLLLASDEDALDLVVALA
jgi:hypothetical protein